ncbi:hypothetical protein [Neolewinella sp.]|uniref:hypothetical protein n=1 Tax=Neolewinella sp. TaxID=2993543 RepID=UPI003B521185
MKCVFALLFTLPLLLFGQRTKTYALDISSTPVELMGLSFNVTRVVDGTGNTEGFYGQVYTGLFNKTRKLTIKNGMELNLGAGLMRSITDRNLPQATLHIHLLRIDEEITVTSERRRLQLMASLEVDGQHFGPQQYTEVRGGLDVTAGHADALAKALSAVLYELGTDLLDGLTGTTSLADNPLPEGLPNGAYYSVADFRIGRVDTTAKLHFRGAEVGQYVDDRAYYRARFLRPRAMKWKEHREFWGYHHEGRSFVFLQDQYYEVAPNAQGRMLVSIPEGLTDVEAMTKWTAVGAGVGGLVGGVVIGNGLNRGGATVYELDLVTGSLTPI